MAYPKHWLFSFGGSLLDDTEIWSNNIRFAVPEGSSEGLVDEGAMLADLMNDLSAKFSQTLVAGGLGYSTNVLLEWGKFNEIGPDGRYADTTNTRVVDLTIPVRGNGAAIGNLPQASLAVSWATARSRGPGCRGRIFVPMPNVANSNVTGRITAGGNGLVATNWANMLEIFNDWSGAPDLTEIIACVVSPIGTGVKEPIRTVRVGNVVDTMRSRRNALVEVYSEVTVPDVDT